jgi:hypothetical protein
MHEGADKSSGWRLPALELETIVLKSLGDFLIDQERLPGALKLRNLSATATTSLILEAQALVGRLNSGNDEKTETIVRSLIKRVTLSATSLSMTVSPVKVLDELVRQLPGAPDTETITLEIPIQIARRGVETKLIIRSARETPQNQDPHLIEAVSKAHRWMNELISGEVRSVREIAHREQMNDSDVSRVLPLAFIAPDILKGILDGEQSTNLTITRFIRDGAIHLDWPSQRHQLRFAERPS